MTRSRSIHSTGRRFRRACPVALAFLGWWGSVSPAGAHDIEFVSEHLPEVAMDHRYAALPVWPSGSDALWQFTAQAGYSGTRTGELELSGRGQGVGHHAWGTKAARLRSVAIALVKGAAALFA